MSEPEVVVLPDAEAVIARAADLFVEAAKASVAARGRFSTALSGGATPQGLYRLLSGARAAEVPWAATDFFFGDERCVPPTDARSNYRAAFELMLGPARVPPERVRRMEGELTPEEGAPRYEDELRGYFKGGPPAFDLALQGLGPDGHTASLFPGSPALKETERWVVTSQAPVEPRRRLTLTLPVLNASRRVLFLVTGSEKAEAVRRALRTQEVPGSLVRPAGSLIFLLDEAAASRLSAP
jgi:6-phosphogluconolactonase